MKRLHRCVLAVAVASAFAGSARTASAGAGDWMPLRQVRELVSRMAPEAVAEQRRVMGLRMPTKVDPSKPLVVLVHGLYEKSPHNSVMKDLLVRDGHQVATFGYPSDQPLDDSAALFREQMKLLVAEYPGVQVDVVAYSQGGLVVRAAIEPAAGRDIKVGKLILVGTPNAGSDWAPLGVVVELKGHLDRWRREEKWSPAWVVTDGLWESLRDLEPGSEFLKRMAMVARRPDVRYTVIAGDVSEVDQTAADLTETAVRVSRKANTAMRSASAETRSAWNSFVAKLGLDQANVGEGELMSPPLERAMDKAEGKAAELRDRRGYSDGPVTVKSAELDGVDDVIHIPATHAELWSGERPAAWEAVRGRLQ